MLRYLVVHLIALSVLSFAAVASAQTPPTLPSIAGAPEDGAAFITLLGTDTLAVERFWGSAEGMEAVVVLRSPRTSVHRYRLDLGGEGELLHYEAVLEEPDATGGVSVLRRKVVRPGGEGLEVEVTEDSETQIRPLQAEVHALPFIDMVHWPFEVMLARAYAAPQDSLTQLLFTSRGTMPFVIRRTGPGTMSVTHPFRGTMDVTLDAEGRLQLLSASGTTRKLTVTRVPWFDTGAFALRSAALDAAGQAFGPLSGRGESVAHVNGATIRLDYGQPAKRGREIFGDLVAWGELWRTGANRATHLETDRELSFGGLAVPAGVYTLFTIPEPNGGTLVINRQTGQTGTAYDVEQDLGRTPMRRMSLQKPVELFTIEVEETAQGGELRLLWDRTAFVIPFTVEGGGRE